MTAKRDDGAAFRDWLIDRLRGTRWATEPLSPARARKVAKVLGVQYDLLMEVRADTLIARAREGFRPGGRQEERTTKIKISYPAEIKAEFEEYCESRALTPSSLMRSVLHAYLRGSYEPLQSRSHTWIWKGKAYRFKATYNYKHCTQLRVPHGAKRALQIRARGLGTTPHAIMRALVLETMEGKFGQADLQIVDTLAMYDDETKYFLGTSAR